MSQYKMYWISLNYYFKKTFNINFFHFIASYLYLPRFLCSSVYTVDQQGNKDNEFNKDANP